MSEQPEPTNSAARQPSKVGNYRVLVACLVFVSGMVGVSYAAVPLYKLFCEVTGYNGTVQRAEQASSVILDRTIRVEFDANTAPDLMWDFKPESRGVDVRIGETIQVMFKATNKWKEASSGEAIFNVTPMLAGAYFNKVECFCFTEVTLKPGETREMPVVFFVDPEIVKQADTAGVSTITLSYTFYARKGDKPVAAIGEAAGGEPRKL